MLAERADGDQPLGRSDRVSRSSVEQEGRDQVLLGGVVHLAEPCGLRPPLRPVAQLGEGLAAPQCERLLEQGGGA